MGDGMTWDMADQLRNSNDTDGHVYLAYKDNDIYFPLGLSNLGTLLHSEDYYTVVDISHWTDEDYMEFAEDEHDRNGHIETMNDEQQRTSPSDTSKIIIDLAKEVGTLSLSDDPNVKDATSRMSLMLWGLTQSLLMD